ncbi:MAG: choice-of-anchor D domain-containing protein [Bacteroidota bacterium]
MKKNYSKCSRLSGSFTNKKRYTTLLLILFFLGAIPVLTAQQMQRIPGEVVVCPAKFKDENSRMAMGQMALKEAMRKAQPLTKKAATAELLITFGPGAQGNTAVQEAFQFALEIWSEEIVSPVPIRIFADFADLGQGVLASAGPTTLVNNFPGAPQADVFYPIALANSLAGEDLAPDLEFDLVVNIGNGIPWYFGTDGDTPAGQFDFVTVALHEAGHGLGFIDGGNVNNNTGVGSINNGGAPFVFDTFIVDPDQNSVLDIPNPSEELGTFLTSGDVFVNGQFAVEALGGVLPELFAPNPFQGGSSIAHWDEATFPAGDPNSLMSPQVGSAESNFDIGDITRGHFRDMGWVLAEQPPFNITPTIFNVELNVEENTTRDITITNVSDGPINLTSLPALGAQIIRSSTPSEFTLAAGESTTVAINLSTEGVLAGLSQESIIFTAEGFAVSDDVTFNFRVLDGTEAPIIVVNPDAFNETIEQFTIETRDLVIDNPGNDNLSFSISVGDNTTPNFASRVNATQQSIKANGFTKQKISNNASRGNSLTSLLSINGTMNRIVSDLFAEDFEGLTPGDINGQAGWFGRFENNWTVSNLNAFDGTQHLRAISDGLGGTRPAAPLALSPTFTVGNEPFSVMSAQVNLEGSGVSWEIIPQNTVQGSVVTRLRFNGDGTIDILDGGIGGFVPVNVAVPEGYFEVRIVVDRDTSALRVFFDGELVYSGEGFANSIDNVALLSDMAVTGSTMDIDNLDVTDGDAEAFFLSVAPISGVVPFGESLTASVTFDGRLLEPGVVNAVITIDSDDPNTPSLDVPVTLTVNAPPSISVNPESISASVNVETDVPPIANSSFVISNSGESTLEFTTSFSPTTFTPQAGSPNDELLKNLDRTKYGLGSNFTGTIQSVKSLNVQKETLDKSILKNTTAVTDSIFYDSGVDFPGGFVGLGAGAPGISTAIQFDVVNQDFALTAVRNAYRTEGLSNVAVLLQVFTGGASPADGELLLEQVVTGDSPNGIVVLEELITPLQFSVGESFWVVHSYPQGIDFPQGTDDTIENTRPNTYAFSSDGGVTYTNLDGFAFLTRALSDGSGAFIELSPRTGTVAPGESLEVSVSLDGSMLPNGLHETDILIESNDPLNPSVIVATDFEVSGQVSGIEVSDELLLFNDVFIGAASERTFTITNTGIDNLNISSIVSDNPDFTVSPDTGVVESGDDLQIAVTFAPTSTGSSNGILTINSNAEGDGALEVIVNGVGVVGPFAVLPEEVSETVSEGKTVETTITLQNEGESPLVFSFPEFTVAAALADPNIPMQVAEVLPFENFSRIQEKGFKDSRIGAPIELSMGRDLGFGYTWIDSDEPGGPVNNFVDITAFGLDLTGFLIDGAGFGDGTVSLALPFPFEFYGIQYEQLFVNANGLLSFQPPTTPTFINGQIPVNDGSNNIIAPLWTDLEPQNGGSVHILGFTDAVIIQWTNAPTFTTGADTGTVTFQIILFDDGTIDVYYENVSSAIFLENATVGIENADGSDGAQVAFNTPYLRDGLALRFIAPEIPLTPFISDISPLSGVVPAGGETTLDVTLDATDLLAGVFFDELRISSNSPDITRSTTLFELTVLEGPRVTGFTLINANTNEPIGSLEDGDIIDLADFPVDINFNIEANVSEFPVGSVVFDFNGEEGFRTESFVPYALGSDNDGNFNPTNIPLGVNSLTATPFTESRGNGDSGLSSSINFDVIRTLQAVTFALIDTDTNTIVSLIEDGQVLDLGTFSTTNFSIEALVGENSVGSIVFDFNGVNNFRTENLVPYALGSNSGEDFIPIDIPLGINNLTANGFSQSNGNGDLVATGAISFEVIRTLSPISFNLIDTDTNTSVLVIEDGDVIDFGQFQTSNFSIEAVVDDIEVGSIVFDFNGEAGFRTESFVPYALGSDNNGNFFPVNIPLGINNLVANGFSQSNGNGDLVATGSISFEVIQNLNPISFSLIDADTNTPIVVIEDGDVIDIGQFQTTNFSIEAIAEGIEVGSIVFDFNGEAGFRTESFVPYALGSDNGGDFIPVNIPLGTNNLVASGFSQSNGQGTLLATGEISFDIQNTQSSEIRVFPNATSDIVNVGSKVNSGKRFTGTIFNMFGQLVRSNLIFDFKSSNTQSFSIAGLSQGIYVLELRDEKGNIVSQKKIIRR